MFRQNKIRNTTLKQNVTYEGETIENKVSRILNNKEPIRDGAPIIYTERKDGVRPEYDIRTDRFDMAIDATDAITKTKHATREQRMGENQYDTMSGEQQKEFNTKFPNNKYNINKKPEGESGA